VENHAEKINTTTWTSWIKNTEMQWSCQ